VKEDCCGKDMWKSLEWKSEGVVDDESGESIEEEVAALGRDEL